MHVLPASPVYAVLLLLPPVITVCVAITYIPWFEAHMLSIYLSSTLPELSWCCSSQIATTLSAATAAAAAAAPLHVISPKQVSPCTTTVMESLTSLISKPLEAATAVLQTAAAAAAAAGPAQPLLQGKLPGLPRCQALLTDQLC